jgi:uncharacterized membrane protein YkvA (DUF1232 family)
MSQKAPAGRHNHFMPWIIRLAILAGLWLFKRQRSKSSPALLTEVNALSWPAKARLTWRLIRDKRVPRWSRGLALLPALYLASPIDLLPDFIPFVGRIDDALVFGLVSDLLLRVVPADILNEHVRSVAPKGPPKTR